MKAKEYFIRHRDLKLHKVEGYPVSHEFLYLFVHKTPTSDNKRVWDAWTVSEYSSGLSIGKGTTMRFAMDSANSNINKIAKNKGKEFILNTIDVNTKLYGVANK